MSLAIISEKIQFYALILTISIGIPGNIISILIFTRACLNTKTNTGLLYTLLCVLNLVAIIYNVLITYSYRLFKYEIQLHFRSELFIGYIQLQFLSWSQVIITFDRFIAVVYPIKGVRLMSKKLVLYSIVLGTFIAIVGLNSPYFLGSSTGMSYEILVLNETVKISMQLFIPYLTMVILDSIAINRLRKVKTNLSERQSTLSNASSKSSRFTRNTILIDLIYLIFNFPSIVFDVYFTYSQIIPNMRIKILERYLDFMWDIFILFPYIYATLIFLVFIVFNKIFRAEVVSMLKNLKNVLLFFKRN